MLAMAKVCIEEKYFDYFDKWALKIACKRTNYLKFYPQRPVIKTFSQELCHLLGPGLLSVSNS